MSNQLEIHWRTIYGEDRAYFVNPETAKAFEALTNRKCVTSKDIAALKTLGLTVTDSKLYRGEGSK